jgi:hypothetical protein
MPTLKLHQRRKRPRLGPYSTKHALTSIDGRCRVALTMREFTRELEAHVGGNPTPAQRVLIREASIKAARLAMMTDAILDRDAPDFDLMTRCYLAWSNSLRRDVEALGLKAPEQKIPQLGQFLAAQPPAKASADPPKRRGRPPKLGIVA